MNRVRSTPGRADVYLNAEETAILLDSGLWDGIPGAPPAYYTQGYCAGHRVFLCNHKSAEVSSALREWY